MSDNAPVVSTPAAAPVASPAPDSSNPVVDFGQILAQQQRETGELRSEIARSRDRDERLRKALAGEDEKKVTRSSQFEDLGSYLKDNAEGLPMTKRIGEQLVQLGLESEKTNAALRQELDDLKQLVDRTRDPRIQGLEHAAHMMEGMVQKGLEEIYGDVPSTLSVRKAQFNAISSLLNDEIKDLMANEPDTLLRIQRDPKLMRKMVNHFSAQILPPKVRERMEAEYIQSQPTTPQELYASFIEAREFYDKANQDGDEKAAHHYSGMMTEIRQQLIAGQLDRRGGTENRPSLNRLLGSYAR